MTYLIAALQAEVLKIRKSKVMWIMMAAFTIAPVMGGFFMFILMDPELAESTGLLGAKAQIQGEANWSNYFSLLAQTIAVGGIIIFGFVTSWVFGREYTDRTIKDLLALPYPNAFIVIAKYVASILVSILLTIHVVVIGCLIGWIIGLPGWSVAIASDGLQLLFITMILTIALSTPVAYFACYGRGYLAPLGFVVGMVVVSQLIAAVGYGEYFPWAVPALYSGISGIEPVLSVTSVAVVILTSIVGFIATLTWWVLAEQD